MALPLILPQGGVWGFGQSKNLEQARQV